MASISVVSNFLAFKVSIMSVSSTGHSAPVKAFSIFLTSMHESKSVDDCLASNAFNTALTITVYSISKNLYSFYILYKPVAL